jgi:hypothetical protein
MKKWLPLVLLIAAAFAWYAEQARESAFDAPTQPVETARADGARVEASPSIETLFAQRLSSVQVQGAGIVSRLLSDDNEGSRHQRFILELPSGHTLLVAHNIDLAPRLDSLKKGDRVEFFGEYEWNERGGVIHWTHHDPKGRHVAGWLKHEGRIYQ